MNSSRVLFSSSIPALNPIANPTPDGPLNQSLLYLMEHCQSFEQLKQFHGRTIVTGLINDRIYLTSFLSLCTRLDSLDHGLSIFDRIGSVDMLMCNTIMRKCVSSSLPCVAFEFYKKLVSKGASPDSYTLPLVIKVCAHLLLHQEGREFHAHVIKFGYEHNIYVQNGLIHMYAEFGDVITSKQVFDSMVVRDVASWTSLMHAYADCGDYVAAHKLFDEMPERNVVAWTTMMECWTRDNQPGIAISAFYEMKVANQDIDGVAVVTLVTACGKLGRVKILYWVHGVIQKRSLEGNVSVMTTLIDMFAKCHSIDIAHVIFNSMSTRSIVTWNVMISCYAELGELGISYYMFNQMPDKNIATWNSLIAGCTRCGCYHQARDVFRVMISSNWKPDRVTLVTLISAIVKSGDLISGKQVHGFIYRSRVHLDVSLGNGLIDMYARFGFVKMARLLFDSMPERNIVSWNTLLIGAAMHGHGNMAVDLFEEMQSSLVKPDEVTFVAILSACSRAGMVKEAFWYFERMRSVYNVEPKVVHFTCMVDLLGRAGYVDDAYRLVKDIPVKPDAILWGALLGACNAHSCFNLGKFIGATMLDVAPDDSATYIALSNIYASENRWVDVKNIRDLMNDKGLKKTYGYSILNVDSEI
ncbi:Pentatricopeptide repeat-containing protein [Nymphaea thermarum]|nr:Pentatricopeptide repeat-containing protein [Nymphaea thermarum]